MLINDPKAFFDTIRPLIFAGNMTQSQVDGVNSIVNEWEAVDAGADPRFVAYSLATAFWETGRTMQPIAEYGHGEGRPYAPIYYGRGLVQLTWGPNYQKVGNLIGKDLYNHPELALEPDIAAQIMVDGMVQGWFTGRKLGDFFNGSRSDWVDARTIINGHDKDALIAGFALHFYHGLTAV